MREAELSDVEDSSPDDESRWSIVDVAIALAVIVGAFWRTVTREKSNWSKKKDIAIAIAAIVGAVWVGVETYLNLFVKGEIERAQVDLAKARRVPSLDFSFEYEGIRHPITGEMAVIVRVHVTNPGVNAVVLDLGKNDDVGEEFDELVLMRVGQTAPEHRLNYLRVDGDTPDWPRVLVDANSTKTIPFLVPSIGPGLYHVEFRARLTPTARQYLIDSLEDTFNPIKQPVFCKSASSLTS